MRRLLIGILLASTTGHEFLLRDKRQQACSRGEFKCKSGECIADLFYCDGEKNCADGSDETLECSALRCQSFTFRCAYGACINADLRCNRIEDCVDGSDEVGCDKKPIEHGRWTVLNEAGTVLQPGERVGIFTIINIACNSGYSLNTTETVVYCMTDGKLSANPLPSCIKVCAPIQSSDTLKVTCDLGHNREANCSRPVEGMRATLQCAELYTSPELQRNPYRFCYDGSWDYPVPKCEVACGLRHGTWQAFAINATSAKRGEFPWQIALYRRVDRRHFCGGSILTPKLSITAAHCFDLPANLHLVIGAGKYYRIYDDARDLDVAQFRNVSRVIIHPNYQHPNISGYNEYKQMDIAILVLESPLKMNRFALPVCLDNNPFFDHATLVNKTGIVTGWGYTQVNSVQAEELKLLEVNYKTRETCTLPEHFLNHFTPLVQDKLCAGLLNQGKAVCQGDSGGPLVFLGSEEKHYYIRGIVSIGPQTGQGCDPNAFTLYTDVKYHLRFITENLSKFNKV